MNRQAVPQQIGEQEPRFDLLEHRATVDGEASLHDQPAPGSPRASRSGRSGPAGETSMTRSPARSAATSCSTGASLAGPDNLKPVRPCLVIENDPTDDPRRLVSLVWLTRELQGLRPDERIDMTDEPDHDELCKREQEYLLKAIDEDIDLSDHMNDGVKSLRIVMAADQSVKTGNVVAL